MPIRRIELDPSTDRRHVELRLIVDDAHYRAVIEAGLMTATTSIWISTANVKDVHVEAPIGTRARAHGRYQSLLEWLKSKADAGLDVRLLHAGMPSRSLTTNPAWRQGSALHRNCPRVHLKMIAVDGRYLYLGSANFTGAGIGAKSEGRRNFEAGIVTDDPLLLDEMQRAFDEIWTGRRCSGCQLRAHCPAPLDGLAVRPPPSPRRTKPKQGTGIVEAGFEVGVAKVRSRLKAPSPRRTKPEQGTGIVETGFEVGVAKVRSRLKASSPRLTKPEQEATMVEAGVAVVAGKARSRLKAPLPKRKQSVLKAQRK